MLCAKSPGAAVQVRSAWQGTRVVRTVCLKVLAWFCRLEVLDLKASLGQVIKSTQAIPELNLDDLLRVASVFFRSVGYRHEPVGKGLRNDWVQWWRPTSHSAAHIQRRLTRPHSLYLHPELSAFSRLFWG